MVADAIASGRVPETLRAPLKSSVASLADEISCVPLPPAPPPGKKPGHGPDKKHDHGPDKRHDHGPGRDHRPGHDKKHGPGPHGDGGGG